VKKKVSGGERVGWERTKKIPRRAGEGFFKKIFPQIFAENIAEVAKKGFLQKFA
jgi:hypothetical protein